MALPKTIKAVPISILEKSSKPCTETCSSNWANETAACGSGDKMETVANEMEQSACWMPYIISNFKKFLLPVDMVTLKKARNNFYYGKQGWL